VGKRRKKGREKGRNKKKKGGGAQKKEICLQGGRTSTKRTGKEKEEGTGKEIGKRKPVLYRSGAEQAPGIEKKKEEKSEADETRRGRKRRQALNVLPEGCPRKNKKSHGSERKKVAGSHWNFLGDGKKGKKRAPTKKSGLFPGIT